jgi:hypothetical protein
MFGWIGNLLIIIGLYGIGDKKRNALWFSMAGEIAYIIHTALVRDWAIFAAAWIFLTMVIRAYINWGKI